MKQVIVIGSDHYNTLWLVRALGIAGYEVISIILGVQNHKSFVSKSKYCSKALFAEDLDSIVTILQSLCLPERTVVFASGDPVAEMLDANYDLLSKRYILHNSFNKQGGIQHWMDKSNMLQKAKECGLAIPYTKSVDTHGDYNIDDVPYPVLIKPEISAEASKNEFRVCEDKQSLLTSLDEVKDRCSKVILQEFIKCDYEYLIYGVSTDDDICMPGGLNKVHTCSSTNNLGMMSLAYLSADIPQQLGNFDAQKKFIREIGYKGLFSVEFMITKDKAYFLEINMRNDGTCYITTQAGVNMPAIWAATAYGEDTSKLRRTFIRENTYGMNEINYVKYQVKPSQLINNLIDWIRTDAYSIFNWKDIRPFIYKVLYSINLAHRGGK